MFKTIYVVHGSTGIYPDSSSDWLVAAFPTASAAEEHRERAQEAAHALFNQLEAQGALQYWHHEPTRYDLGCTFIDGPARYRVEPIHLVEGALPREGMFKAPTLEGQRELNTRRRFVWRQARPGARAVNAFCAIPRLLHSEQLFFCGILPRAPQGRPDKGTSRKAPSRDQEKTVHAKARTVGNDNDGFVRFGQSRGRHELLIPRAQSCGNRPANVLGWKVTSE
jgi:hypothetical protein